MDFSETYRPEIMPYSALQIQFDKPATKVKFTVQSSHGLELTFISNKEFGLILKRNGEDTYLDVDLGLGQTNKHLYLISANSQLYVTVGGLSYADIIYKTPLHSASSILTLQLDHHYTNSAPVLHFSKFKTTQLAQQLLYDTQELSG